MNQFIAFVISHWVLWVALVIIIALIILEEAGGYLRGIQQMTLNNAVNLINHEHPIIIDLRNNEKFNDGHILHSLNIPAVDFSNNLKKIKSKDSPLLLVSDNEQDLTKVSGILKQNNFTKVYSLKGGINAWQRENFPLTKE
jgi:rhodanese-related sulfurtransferase